MSAPSKKKRLEAIDDEVTILRETHRHVLAWNQLTTPPFQSFLVSLGKDDAAALVRLFASCGDGAADADAVPPTRSYATASCELCVEDRGATVVLHFRRRGDDEEGSHTLNHEGRLRFLEVLSSLAPG